MKTEIYKLNKQQQSAFDALKRAANKCNKLNIGFVNIYGSIHPFDKSVISGFNVDSGGDVECKYNGYPINCIDNLGGDSYADDQNLHYFNLTDKGKKIFKEDEN